MYVYLSLSRKQQPSLKLPKKWDFKGHCQSILKFLKFKLKSKNPVPDRMQPKKFPILLWQAENYGWTLLLFLFSCQKLRISLVILTKLKYSQIKSALEYVQVPVIFYFQKWRLILASGEMGLKKPEVLDRNCLGRFKRYMDLESHFSYVAQPVTSMPCAAASRTQQSVCQVECLLKLQVPPATSMQQWQRRLSSFKQQVVTGTTTSPKFLLSAPLPSQRAKPTWNVARKERSKDRPILMESFFKYLSQEFLFQNSLVFQSPLTIKFTISFGSIPLLIFLTF